MDDLEANPKVKEITEVISALTQWLDSKLKISHHTHSIDAQHKGLDQVCIWMTLKHFPKSQRSQRSFQH